MQFKRSFLPGFGGAVQGLSPWRSGTARHPSVPATERFGETSKAKVTVYPLMKQLSATAFIALRTP